MSESPILAALYSRPDFKPNSNGGGVACCPYHDDEHQSLSITLGDDGRVLLKCHAGCETKAVVEALGYTLADLFPPKPGTNGHHKTTGSKRIVATYDYHDEQGDLLFQVLRYDPKGFKQRRPDGAGGWNWKVTGTRQVPYHLNELEAHPSKLTFVCEGGWCSVGSVNSGACPRKQAGQARVYPWRC